MTNVSTIYTAANIQTPEELSASLAIPQVAEQLKPVISTFQRIHSYLSQSQLMQRVLPLQLKNLPEHGWTKT